MSVIDIKNLTFCYDGGYENIFENVSLRLDTDWKLGLIGRNGRGKTTFLKLLMGKYEYGGNIASSISFDYFPLEIKDKSMFGIDIAEEINPGYEYWRLSKETNLLGLDDEILYRPYKMLSGGEQTKLMLAIMFMKQDDFLLIDEPTNHLDTEGRKKVGDYLRAKHGFILVSHDRCFMDSCVDHILSINRTGIELQQGNFSSWQRNKQMRDDFETGRNAKLEKEIKRLSSAAKQSGAWAYKTERSKHKSAPNEKIDRGFAGHKSAKAMKRSKNIEIRREKAVSEKAELLKDIESNESLKISPLKYGRIILNLKDFAVKYDGKTINKPISFEIKDGGRILLKGTNGCGKSSIMKAIAAGGIDFNGIMEKGSNIAVSYVPQDISFLKGSLRDFAAKKGIDESRFKTILRKMDFSRTQFDEDMESYSAGQKKKALIAMSLCQSAHLYVWDEPLNYIDVFSRIQIEELIDIFKPTMLFAEHDIEFSKNIATDVVTVLTDE